MPSTSSARWSASGSKVVEERVGATLEPPVSRYAEARRGAAAAPGRARRHLAATTRSRASAASCSRCSAPPHGVRDLDVVRLRHHVAGAASG